MTRLAAPAVLACPRCHELLLQKRLASINNFGATYWSDGYASIFMMPEAGRLGSCPACGSAFWVEDAPLLGRLPKEPVSLSWSWLRRMLERCAGSWAAIQVEEDSWHAVPKTWHRALTLDEPKPAELRAVLHAGPAAPPEREIYLRTRLWWIGNHEQRGMTASNPMSIQERTDNMMALLELIRTVPESGNGTVVEGELLRQLGRFDDAVSVLKSVAKESDMAACIQKLALEGNMGVGVVRDVSWQ